MKYIVLFAAVVAVASAALLPVADKDAQIVSQESDNIGIGPYRFA